MQTERQDTLRFLVLRNTGEARDSGFITARILEDARQLKAGDFTTDEIWKALKEAVSAGVVGQPIEQETGQPLLYKITEVGQQELDAMATTKKIAKDVAADAAKKMKVDSRIPVAGTKLKREFKGKDYEVIVRHNGFEYLGKLYSSLRAVAIKITGYPSASGHQFFGLWKAGDNIRQKACAGKPKVPTVAGKPVGKEPTKKAPKVRKTRAPKKASPAKRTTNRKKS